jgi:hypothetical protein
MAIYFDAEFQEHSISRSVFRESSWEGLTQYLGDSLRVATPIE